MGVFFLLFNFVIFSTTILQHKICEIRRESSDVFHKIYDVFRYYRFSVHHLHHNLKVAIPSHRNCFYNCLTNRFTFRYYNWANFQSFYRRSSEYAYHNPG